MDRGGLLAAKIKSEREVHITLHDTLDVCPSGQGNKKLENTEIMRYLLDCLESF